MSNPALKQRFAEQMRAAGFKTVAELASQIVLHIPQDVPYPLSPKDIRNTANSIQALMTGTKAPINLKGEFSPLAQEVATLLNASIEELFADQIAMTPLQYDHVYSAMVQPIDSVAGQDQDKPFIVRDLEKIRQYFKPAEWSIINEFYVQGLTTHELAQKEGCPATKITRLLEKINHKLHRIGQNVLDGYHADPAEYFFPADLRPMHDPQRSNECASLFRAAYRASCHPHNAKVAEEVVRAQLKLSHKIVRGAVPDYLDIHTAPELADIVNAFSYMPQMPDIGLVWAWKNTLSYLSETIPSNYKTIMHDACQKIASRLDGHVPLEQLYKGADVKAMDSLRHIVKGVDELLSSRPPFPSFTIR